MCERMHAQNEGGVNRKSFRGETGGAHAGVYARISTRARDESSSHGEKKTKRDDEVNLVVLLHEEFELKKVQQVR